MAVGSKALLYHTKQLHYLRGTVDYTDGGVAKVIGYLPQGAIVCKAISGAMTTTAFTGTGTDLLDVGYGAYTNSAGTPVVADPNAFGTGLDIATTGWDALDETAADFYANSNEAGVPVTATYTDASGDASAGSAEVVIAFFADLGE